VHVTDADTGDGLGGVSVILYDPPDSHGSIHVKTDAKGNACLDVNARSREGFLVGTSSFDIDQLLHSRYTNLCPKM
jgi:hypothetical protein